MVRPVAMVKGENEADRVEEEEQENAEMVVTKTQGFDLLRNFPKCLLIWLSRPKDSIVSFLYAGIPSINIPIYFTKVFFAVNHD